MNILIEWIAEEEHWMNNQIEWTFEIRYWIEYWIESFVGPIQRLIESSKSIEHPYAPDQKFGLLLLSARSNGLSSRVVLWIEGFSARRVRKRKSKRPKDPQLEVGPSRDSRLCVYNKQHTPALCKTVDFHYRYLTLWRLPCLFLLKTIINLPLPRIWTHTCIKHFIK